MPGKNNRTSVVIALPDPADAGLLDVTIENPVPAIVVADVQSSPITVGATPAQVVVATSGTTLIAPANPKRRSLLLTNLTGTQLCHLGNVSVTATSSRALLTAAVGSNVTFYAKDAIYGVSAVAAQTVLVWEEVAS